MKKRAVALVAALMMIGSLSGCANKAKDYSDYMTLGEYKGLEYTELSTEVTDEELQTEVDYFLQQCATEEKVTEGTVADGDTVNIDYVGYVDGTAFEGGDTQGNGTNLTIGSGQYIDDFEQQLIGHAVGEEGIEVKATFPEPYKQNEDLSGKEATFIVKINYISVSTAPTELTDELVAANSSYSTVNAFMDALSMDYKNWKVNQADTQKKTDLITAAIEKSTINSIPEEELQALVDETIKNITDQATSNNMDYASYIAMYKDGDGNPYTEETYKEKITEYANELMKEKMVVYSIAKGENITASKDEITAYVNAAVSSDSTMSSDDIYEMYSDEELAYFVIYDKVIDLLVENGVAKAE